MRNANVICKCHDWSYQCVMQPLCPNMLLTDSLTTDLDVNFSMNANKMLCKPRFSFPMQMPFLQGCRCNFLFFWCKMPFVGMPWCKCLLVGMPWCKYFDANTIYSNIPFVFKSRLPQRLKPKYFQNSIYYSQKVIHFIT